MNQKSLSIFLLCNTVINALFGISIVFYKQINQWLAQVSQTSVRNIIENRNVA